MASAKSFMRATNYRFLSTDTAVIRPSHGHGHTNSFELDESDVWGGLTQSNSTDLRNPPPSSRRPIASPRKRRGGEAMSMPVNVPDWSKILREEYKDKWSAANIDGDYDGGDDVGGDDEWVPPHEYLARTRNASFSMQEGVGRTLKGRDLSRVRNAIWEKTGFQD